MKSCFDANELLEDCQLLSTFINRTNKQSNRHPDRYEPYVYKGDALECFVEALIKLSPVDNRIGITDYEVVRGIDTGVDGHGIGLNGEPATVQVKFRSDHRQKLTANRDHLSNFTNTSMMEYDVNPKSTTNFLIITTSSGLNSFTDKHMFKKRVRCIDRGQLRSLVDNNQNFLEFV